MCFRSVLDIQQDLISKKLNCKPLIKMANFMLYMCYHNKKYGGAEFKSLLLEYCPSGSVSILTQLNALTPRSVAEQPAISQECEWHFFPCVL